MPRLPDRRVHPETGEELRRGVRPLTLSYRGLETTVQMPGWYAADDPTGENGLHAPGDMKVSDRALVALKARAGGLLDPDAIRTIRKKLRLTQRAAGHLIGGGPNAFQRYEAGEVMISKPADTALRLLANDPSRVDELRLIRGDTAA